MNISIEKFKRNGFVNLGQILPVQDVENLANICNELYLTIDKTSPSFFEGSVDGCNDLISHRLGIAGYINSIITNPKIRHHIDLVVGSNCKIFDIAFRRSKPGDLGLYLHQDGVGQVNMVICLDDNHHADGSTAFLAGSHLISRSIGFLRLEMPALLLNLCKFLFTPLSCNKGDVCFFSNRVWHGRFRNDSRKNHDIILVGFFPKGYSYYNKSWPDSIIDQVEPMVLASYLGSASDYAMSFSSSSCDTRDRGNFFTCKDHGYSMSIENPQYLSSIKKPKKLFFSVILIYFLINIFRYPHKILKFTISKLSK